MDEWTATRRSLHAVAEHLLAGPQHREHGTIRLRVTPGGFGQVAGPWRVEGADLVGDGVRVPLRGSVRDVGLRAFAPDVEPVLWPEHFDLALTLDEVNYGISPGDAGHAAPYAYVGPWTPRTGPFWNAPFGALRPAADLPDAAAVAAFLDEGRAS